MPPIFDAYVMVDWSAAAVPARGADSIWIGAFERRGGAFFELALANPATRAEACGRLADLFSDLIARGCVTLAGFDFAFGFPQGFAGRLRPNRPDWRGVWAEIAGRIEDGDDNRNNRFVVAAALNEKVSGRAFPFWGCVNSTAPQRCLGATKPCGYDTDTLAEYRLTDRVTTGPKSVWQLAYTGSVGSQTLLGIARLFALRHHPWLADAARIWPFETGLGVLRPGKVGCQVLFAETYPSLLAVEIAPGEVRDRAQVRALARHFARLDDDDRLGPLFAGPPALSAADKARIETEEAWILGIETAARPRPAASVSVASVPTASVPTANVPTAAPVGRYDYLREPAAIYRRSFELIRAACDFSGLPEALRSLAERVVHAAGDPSVLGDLAWTDGVVERARAALARGRPIFVDAAMVAAGIIRARLPADNAVVCRINDPDLAQVAQAAGTTRSAVAVERWVDDLEGAVVAIGNAPTALFRLLELLDAGGPRPAAIFAFPVGFVGAAEAKDALIAHGDGAPFLTLKGRRGGSALAAAAINALGGEGA